MRPLAPLCLALALAAPPARAEEESERPFVEILDSSGAVDGPSESGVAIPRWERVRLELRIQNRLAAAVVDLEVEVALLASPGTGGAQAAPIPGWSFKESFPETTLDPLADDYLRIARELPARRTSPPADEIAYRARIKSYRLLDPDLDTAIRLLGSSKDSDQLAALRSYERVPERDPQVSRALGRALARALAELPEEPSAPDALRMLFAVRALGTLGDPGEVQTLLELPGTRDGAVWAQAVADLSERMARASQSDEPRLRVLPSWAKEPALRFRAADALEDAVRDSVLLMGDAAVPSLLSAAHLGAVPGVRARAKRLLHALGRATVRSQLALKDREAKLAVIEALGSIGSTEPLPALVELLKGHDVQMKDAARLAIKRVGEPALEALAAALGSSNDEQVLASLLEIGDDVALLRLAQRYGLTPKSGEPAAAVVAALRARLHEEQRARRQLEIQQALDQAREGSAVAAFQRLDRVFAQDPELYMGFAEPIARAYAARAEMLAARGDHDAAVATAKTALSIHELPELRRLLLSSQMALAHGYLELGELDQAEESLDDAEAQGPNKALSLLRARLLAERARAALASGNRGRARTLVEHARALQLEDEALSDIRRRLLVADNLAILVVLALLVPAALLAAILMIRHRLEAERMEQLATVIDRGKS